MNHMKKLLVLFSLIGMLSLSGCKDFDDFDFSGTVVGYRYCTSMANFQDLGYIIHLDAPDTVGGTLVMNDGSKLNNVIVVYLSDRLLRDQTKLHGRMYLDPKFSKANCTLHSTGADKDLPEAVFTKIVID